MLFACVEVAQSNLLPVFLAVIGGFAAGFVFIPACKRVQQFLWKVFV